MLQHGAGDFALAHDDGIGREPRQILDFIVGMGSRHDMKARVQRPRLLNDLPGGIRLMGNYLKLAVILGAIALVPTILMSDGINHYNSIDITPNSPGIGCVMTNSPTSSTTSSPRSLNACAATPR